MTNDIVVNSEIVNNLSPEQFYELVKGIREKRNISHKFAYLSKSGADYWDSFYKRHTGSDTYTTLQTIQLLLEQSKQFLTYLVGDKNLHVVDLGPGNGYPLKNTVEHFTKAQSLKSYTAFDFSPTVNQLALSNMKLWIGDVELCQVEGDFENFDFTTIFNAKDNEVNLLYLIGGTVSNIEDRSSLLRRLIRCLGDDDIFIVNFTLKEGAKKIVYGTAEFRDFEGILPMQLGIDLHQCKQAVFFEEATQRFLATITLDKDYSLFLRKGELEERIELKQGETLTIWMHLISSFQDIIKLLEDSGGTVFSATKSLDETQGIFFVKRKVE